MDDSEVVCKVDVVWVRVGRLELIIYARPNHERLSIPLFSLDGDNDDNTIKHDERKSSIYPSPRIPHGCK